MVTRLTNKCYHYFKNTLIKTYISTGGCANATEYFSEPLAYTILIDEKNFNDQN